MADNCSIHARVNPTNGDLEFVMQSTNAVVAAFRGEIFGLPVCATQPSLTAHAGGGQTNATPITATLVEVTTVASNGDSVILPPTLANLISGLEITISNGSATHSINVFPPSGEAINALAINTAFSLAAGKTAVFNCLRAGQWYSLLSA